MLNDINMAFKDTAIQTDEKTEKASFKSFHNNIPFHNRMKFLALQMKIILLEQMNAKNAGM